MSVVNMSVEIMLLGAAQDAGLPQMGCQCENCTAVRNGNLPADTAASLAIIDRDAGNYWLVDATPDIRTQVELVNKTYPNANLAGVFITHAHIGHYTGLMFLGRESMNTQNLPVYCSQVMADYLSNHAPWQQLVSLNNIELICIQSDVSVRINERLKVIPTLVPHRGEYSDTYAFSFIGDNKSMFFCPDIDRWEAWNQDIRQVVSQHDYSLLDATFYNDQELPGRDMSKIPHPLVTDTMDRLKGFDAAKNQVVLVHINHTNPIYSNVEIRRVVADAGFIVGVAGLIWGL